MDTKCLNINLDKSVFVLLGRKDIKLKTQKEIARIPLTYEGNVLKQKTRDKWLGEQIDAGGESSSIKATINARKPRIMTSILEITSIIEETRMNRIGGLQCGLDLWEIAVIPSLLYNSNCWSSLTEEEINNCENIQLYFLRSILAVPKSTPKPSLVHQWNSLLMKTRILKNILNLAKHIATLPNTSLANEIFNEQLVNKWPGLIKDAEKAARLFEIDFDLIVNRDISKISFKRYVKKQARIFNNKTLKDSMTTYKKLDQIINENPAEVKYFRNEPVFSGRQIFRFKTEMYEAKLNFKRKYNNNNNFLCDSCQSQQDQNSHVLYCESYKDLRAGKNLQSDRDLGMYLQQVLQIRTQLRLTR